LYAIKSNGKYKFKFIISSKQGIYLGQTTIGKDGTVYVSNKDYLYAINSDGILKWKYKIDGPAEAASAIDAQRVIYVYTIKGYLYAIKPDGTLKWKFFLSPCNYESSPVIGPNKTIYVACNVGLYAIADKNNIVQPDADTYHFPFVEKHDLVNGPYHSYSKLTVTPLSVRNGGWVSVDIRFYSNGGDGGLFYNPFFDMQTALPGQLALYDSKKKYLLDLIAFRGGSFIGGMPATFIPHDGYVGTDFSFPTDGWHPGNYYLQFIYFKRFIDWNEEQKSRKPLDRSELFCSNSVKITVLPPNPLFVPIERGI
jgi:hypothetical protein